MKANKIYQNSKQLINCIKDFFNFFLRIVCRKMVHKACFTPHVLVKMVIKSDITQKCLLFINPYSIRGFQVQDSQIVFFLSNKIVGMLHKVTDNINIPIK